MLIGGFQKTTLIDYPGKIAATVFTVGCNFRCPFCYNLGMVLPEKIKNQPMIPQADFFRFLKKRKGLVEGIVICGGEPTIHKDLPNFIKKIKEMGFLVKLDTNGFNPEVLEDLIEKKLLDYVAMDIKAPQKKYEFFSGVKGIDLGKIKKSIYLLKEGKIDYEFRTTVAPGLLKDDIIKIANWISPAQGYFLQEVNLQKEIIDSGIKSLPRLSREEIEKIVGKIKSKFKTCNLR